MNRNETVSLEYRVQKAFEGKYFMGHTPVMTLYGNANAWGALVNPAGSGVNLYINTFTVTNFSETAIQAQLWLNGLPGSGMASPFVSPSNTAISPLPMPHASIRYAQHVGTLPEGTSLFSRIAEPQATTVGNYYGKIVVPPGGSFIAFLYSPGRQVYAEVAFGWWEDTV